MKTSRSLRGPWQGELRGENRWLHQPTGIHDCQKRCAQASAWRWCMTNDDGDPLMYHRKQCYGAPIRTDRRMPARVRNAMHCCWSDWTGTPNDASATKGSCPSGSGIARNGRHNRSNGTRARLGKHNWTTSAAGRVDSTGGSDCSCNPRTTLSDTLPWRGERPLLSNATAQGFASKTEWIDV